MKLVDTAMLAVTTLQHRSLRSWLAVLGIVVGVAAIISLISISLGMSAQISSRMNTLGANVITISPGGQNAQRMGLPGFSSPTGQSGGGGPEGPEGGPFAQRSSDTITFREAETLRVLPGVEALDARLEKRETLEYLDKNASLTVVGSDPDAFAQTVGVGVLAGRGLSASDQYSVVLGYSVANSTFADLGMLNKQVRISGVAFKVVGILNASGSSSFGSADRNVFIPLRTAKKLFNQSTNVSEIIVIASSGYGTDEVAAGLEEELISLHGVTAETEDFQIQTASTVQSTVSDVTGILTLFLGGIASISLLVGGIGVANTMFMSVLEQTRYIGILKALGSKSRDVLGLFMFEAGIIGLAGGVLGAALSIGVSFALASFSIPSLLTPELILGGIGFSVLVGLVSGVVPARNAAALEPIDALRYE